ncbi:hypothetical protein O9929_05400 [Vibrio lentus]|nr:hypothetical protein [Vibrio lentus]
MHAVLTGLSLYIAASMEWMAGFGFSAGFVDLVLSSQNPLATSWYVFISSRCGVLRAFTTKLFSVSLSLSSICDSYRSW